VPGATKPMMPGARKDHASADGVCRCRFVTPETRAYLDRRIGEGKSKREALRSLKRRISRELYRHLTQWCP